MKHLYLIISLTIVFGFTQTTQAQFFEKLKKKTEQKIKSEGEKRVEKKMNKTVEKGYDEVEKTVEGDGTKKEEKKTDDSKQTTSTDTKQTNNDQTAPVKDSESNFSVMVNSKYDFIPGEKIIFFDDFTSENVGDFPILWNTTGSGEVVTNNLDNNRWFYITNGNGISALMEPLNLPDNYTIEFDVVPMKNLKNNGSADFTFWLFSTTKPKDLKYGLARPGGTGIKFSFGYNNYVTAYYADGTPVISGREDVPKLKADTKYRMSIWVQKSRIRLYVNETKLFDLPKAVPQTPRFNMIRFDGGTPMITNVRVASGLPDMRSKLLTEGKLVSYGIYFDVNKSVVKPESYPSIKEIGQILKDNPDVRIKIIGHTDSDGDDKSNLELSKNRSAAVKNVLVSEFQIDASRIETDGKGETEKVAPNDSAVNKALNRRVEFIKL